MKRTVEIGEPFDREMEANVLQIARALSNVSTPITLLVNKTDLLNKNKKGFIINNDVVIPDIYQWMLRLDCKSFLDLGSGVSVLTNILKQINEFLCNSEIKFSGIEEDEKLIEFSKILYPGISTKKGNILKIKKEDIKKVDILYMYEPILSYKGEKFVKKFINKLIKIMNYDQTIILNSVSNIEFLRNHPNIHILCEDDVLVVCHKTTPSRKKNCLEETVYC